MTMSFCLNYNFDSFTVKISSIKALKYFLKYNPIYYHFDASSHKISNKKKTLCQYTKVLPVTHRYIYIYSAIHSTAAFFPMAFTCSTVCFCCRRSAILMA